MTKSQNLFILRFVHAQLRDVLAVATPLTEQQSRVGGNPLIQQKPDGAHAGPNHAADVSWNSSPDSPLQIQGPGGCLLPRDPGSCEINRGDRDMPPRRKLRGALLAACRGCRVGRSSALDSRLSGRTSVRSPFLFSYTLQPMSLHRFGRLTAWLRRLESGPCLSAVGLKSMI